MPENTPALSTPRLILRRFEPFDLSAVYRIYRDEEVNTFLPWFPARDMSDAARLLKERYLSVYRQPRGYAYALCLREDNVPIGYLHADLGEAHDLGYGLLKEYWHRGLITEAGRALIDRLRADGLPFVTATHDANNPASGRVMARLGMTYRYSYLEQWQPKNRPVVFRLYQLNLNGGAPTYRGFWDAHPAHFIENTHP